MDAIASSDAMAFFMAKAVRSKRPTFEILGIDHVVLRVRDAGRMVRFYCEVLGCTVERTREDRGLTQLRAGQSLIDLIAADDKPAKMGGCNMDHFCLRIEPFDQGALVSHLVAHGAMPGEAHTRYGADGYGPSVYVEDPEGNVIELKGPATASA